MDIQDIFENLGLGLGIVIIVLVFLFVMILFSTIVPALLWHLGGLLLGLIAVIFLIAVFYFIGKFAKDFIK